MMLILHHTPLHALLRCSYLNKGSTAFPLFLTIYTDVTDVTKTQIFFGGGNMELFSISIILNCFRDNIFGFSSF